MRTLQAKTSSMNEKEWAGGWVGEGRSPIRTFDSRGRFTQAIHRASWNLRQDDLGEGYLELLQWKGKTITESAEKSSGSTHADVEVAGVMESMAFAAEIAEENWAGDRPTSVHGFAR